MISMPTPEEPDFVSRQTVEARRFYMNLKPSPYQPLTVVCGGVERTHKDYVIERSSFPYYALEWVAEGEGTLSYGDQVHRLTPGTVFAYGSNMYHKITNLSPTGMRKYYLDLAGEEARTLLMSAGLLDREPIKVSRVVELNDLWDFVDREARENGRLAFDLCVSHVRTLMLKVRQRRLLGEQVVPTAFQTYETIRTYMETNYLTVQTIEEVAEACEVSSVYLSRLFKRFSGTGAYRFLLRLKMNYAAELLLEEKLLVKEVAERLSYSDAFQFSRAFKRIFGLSPTHLVNSRKPFQKSGLVV